jgi:hypothetical protein
MSLSKQAVRITWLWTILAFLAAPHGAEAFPRLDRDRIANIEAIDHSLQRLHVRLRDTGDRFVVQWSERTKFFTGGVQVSPMELRPGAEVELRYRAPLLGPRVARRVKWKGAPSQPNR